MAEERPTDQPAAEETRPRHDTSRIPDVIPIIGSGATVMYPSQLMPVLAKEDADIRAIDEAAVTPAKVIGIFAQRAVDGQHEGDMYPLGTAATIARLAKSPDGSLQAVLQGVARIRLLGIEQSAPYQQGRVESIPEELEHNLKLEAMARSAVANFQRIVNTSDAMPKELSMAVTAISDPGALADFIAANLQIKTEDRQAVLEAVNVSKRLRLALNILNHELEVSEMESKIQAEVKGEIDKRQREYILREQ
ncbi:MAG: LON peptidase substrate-binding domain-containing protein, partial [Dehalococcoidia bacterium]